MNSLECAKKLKELLKNNRKHLKSGLCGFLVTLNMKRIINVDEYCDLDAFINDNNPHGQENRIWYSMWRKDNYWGYYFKKGNYIRRLIWINSLIEKYSK